MEYSNAANQPTKEMPWSTGLFDCFHDVPSCCLTYWCPCVAFGRMAEIIDKGSPSCCASGALYTLLSLVPVVSVVPICLWLYTCSYRSKMRKQYMLQESPCADFLVHFFCEGCALCQEYRELKNRGFDPSIGWHGNVEKQNRGVTLAPAVEGGMSRADK